MIREFYKTTEGRWYIDYPEFLESGGDLADLEMVAGADELLNIASKGKDRIKAEMRLSRPEKFDYKLTFMEEEHGGANYWIENLEFPAWLCFVTAILFGEFPENLYISVINE